jgi:hypothetical protein
MPTHPFTDPAPLGMSPSAALPDHLPHHSAEQTMLDDKNFEHGGNDERVSVSVTISFALTNQDHIRAIDEIRERWNRRQSWHRSEKSLTLAARAMCRRLVAMHGTEKADKKEADKLYDAALGIKRKGKLVTHELSMDAITSIAPLIAARDSIEPMRKEEEKELARLAKSLPIAPYIEDEIMRGVGIASLAALIGEAGDLGNYSNPAKLWKRMGLAVMPDGRQRKHKDKLLAIAHGYSPARRSVMWNFGDCIVKTRGALRTIYDERKAYEIEKAIAQGLTILPAAKITEKNKDKCRSEGHIHSRAKRYVEKRVLLLLWRAWRKFQ